MNNHSEFCNTLAYPWGGGLCDCRVSTPVKPAKRPAYMDYPDGIADVKVHYRDGGSHLFRRVQFDTIGGSGPHGAADDTSGEWENGDIFHVPNVLWWEVVFLDE